MTAIASSQLPSSLAPAGCYAGSHAAHQLSPQQFSFLLTFQQHVQPKLRSLMELLASQQVSSSLALAQVWTYLPVLLEGQQVLKAERLCLLGAPQLEAFHTACAEEGVPAHLLGPMSKAWEGGVVKVVQSLENLSRETHPCNRLQGPLESSVAELVYVPIFDRGPCAASGVVAVLELLVSSRAHDFVAVADAISCAARLMDALQLSLSNPLTPGHGPSPPASPPKPAAGARAELQQQQQQQAQAAHTHLAPLCTTTAGQQLAATAPAEDDTAPTAPSSPSATAVPTPLASPAAASPFATITSPLDSPTRAAGPAPGAALPPPPRRSVDGRRSMDGGACSPTRPPRGRAVAAAPGVDSTEELLSRVCISTPAQQAFASRRSAPPSLAQLPPANSAGAAAAQPAWPAAGWGQGGAASGEQHMQKAASGGSIRRTLSRTASFRKDLNTTNDALMSDMSTANVAY